MSKIIDRTGKGSNISQAENDVNLDSLHGINQAISGTSHTVTIVDQGDTLEFTSGSAVAVTLDDIATILGAAHTSDFKVTLVGIGAGTITITPDGTDSFNIAGGTYVLEQNEYVTLQTDSTNAIWNIINNSDALTLGGSAKAAFFTLTEDETVTGDTTFDGEVLVNATSMFPAFGSFTCAASPVVSNDENVASVTKIGVGNYRVTFTSNFSAATYAVLATLQVTGSSNGRHTVNIETTGKAVGQFEVWIYDNSESPSDDPDYVHFQVFGTLA